MRRFALSVAAALVVVSGTAAGAQAAVPVLSPATASEVSGESAVLEGAVNPSGAATTYHFEYVPLSVYSQSEFAASTSTAALSAGSGTEAVPVSVPVAGLVPDTTYYFRLSATNASGTTVGTAQTVTTSHGIELACEGDACQFLPSPPGDPTLTTLLSGPGNPKVRYHRLNHHKKKRKPKRYRQARHPHRSGAQGQRRSGAGA